MLEIKVKPIKSICVGGIILAHLWGAYAIPMALSVIRCTSYFVCRLCPPQLSEIRHKIHVPGLCLLDIGGAPALAIKLWLKPYFRIFSSSLRPPTDGASY